MKKMVAVILLLVITSVSVVFGANNLPIDGTKSGVVIGYEAGWGGHVVNAVPFWQSFKIGTEAHTLGVGYLATHPDGGQYQAIVFGGVMKEKVEDDVEFYGDADISPAIFGMEIKAAPSLLSTDHLKCGLVVDVARVGGGSRNVSSSWDYGSLPWTESAKLTLSPYTRISAVAPIQWQPAVHLVVFAGPKWTHLIGQKVKMDTVISGTNIDTFGWSETFIVEQVKEWSAVGGVVLRFDKTDVAGQVETDLGNGTQGSLSLQYHF